jgi:uncharacterized protein (DUF302 family)
MYYLNKTVDYSFESAEAKIIEYLKEEQFGILTEIDMKSVMKKKLDKDILPYKILGACNPNFAYEALQEEEKIGIMLPCNVTIIEKEDGNVDVSIVDPEAVFKVVDNDAVKPFALEVKKRLSAALSKL